jgi:hypothetical protein
VSVLVVQFLGRHWRALVLAVVTGAGCFWVGLHVGKASVTCPPPTPCPEVSAQASAGSLAGSLACEVKGWHVVDLNPPAMVASGPVPVPPKTVTQRVEVLRTIPGPTVTLPVPAGPCTAQLLVPDLALTAQGALVGPQASSQATPTPAQPTPMHDAQAGRWGPSTAAGWGSQGLQLQLGFGYAWGAGKKVSLAAGGAPLHLKDDWRVLVVVDW